MINKKQFGTVEVIMILGTMYIFVSDIGKSVRFYKELLQEEPLYANDDRWVQFSNKIALYNKNYDVRIIGKEPSIRFNQAYIDDFYRDTGNPKNNIVVFNFVVEDLKKEYERLKTINIGEVSELMYVNVHMPYWYFNIFDPDGNTLEITGKYE
jgi:lactoylglutathione lyase